LRCGGAVFGAPGASPLSRRVSADRLPLFESYTDNDTPGTALP